MSVPHHTNDTRNRIGKSVQDSSWRRRSRDKSSELQSVAGQWDEDYSTPVHGHHAGIGLWEETHNRLVW